MISPSTDSFIPRPEYPRPQFVRSRWLNLNGTWGFRTDDDDAGLEKSWFSRPEVFEDKILVPFSFESEMSGIADRSFHPRVWYRRTFSVPEEWRGLRLLLNFGAVDYRAIVWVNGVIVATHEGGHRAHHRGAGRRSTNGPLHTSRKAVLA